MKKKLNSRRQTEGELRWLERGLKTLGFFSKLTVAQLSTILPYMTAGSSPKGHVVVKQGASGDRFYLIKKGKVEVLRSGKKVAALGPGQFFGEMALLFKQPRSATVKCSARCVLFSLGNADLRRVMRKNPQVGRQIKKIAEQRRLELEQRS